MRLEELQKKEEERKNKAIEEAKRQAMHKMESKQLKDEIYNLVETAVKERVNSPKRSKSSSNNSKISSKQVSVKSVKK